MARKYNISVYKLWTLNKLSIGKKLLIKFGHHHKPNNGMLAQGNK